MRRVAGLSSMTQLPENLLATLRPDRPRLLAPADAWTRLASPDLSSDLAQRLTAVHTVADRLLDTPPLTYDIPDGKRLLMTSRKAVDRAYHLAIAARLHPTGPYLPRLAQELDAVCAFPDWNPSHFLDVAEMAHAVALAYDWLHDHWSDDQHQRYQATLLSHALEPALERYDDWRQNRKSQYHDWPAMTNNWNVICNAGTLSAALALADTRPDLLAQVLRHAFDSLPACLQHFAPDGGWPEGTGYWAYTARYLDTLLRNLDTAFGHTFNLDQTPGLKQTARFVPYLTGPTGLPFNFADSKLKSPSPQKGGNPLSYLLWQFARRYRDPIAQAFSPEPPEDAPLALLSHTPNPKPTPPPAPPLDAYFRGVEAVAFRSAWHDPHALFVATQCGRNTVGHNQTDLGSFVLDALGVRFIADLGPDDYNLPHYFGPLRYHYYRNRAEGHNTLVINPNDSPGQDPQAGGSVTHFDPHPDNPIAEMDLTTAYPQLTRYTRRFTLPHRKALTVEDTLQTRDHQPVDLYWFAHTQADITLSSDGRTATLIRLGQSLRVTLDTPADAAFQSRPASPLPTSPNPEGQNPNDGSQPEGNRRHVHRQTVVDLPSNAHRPDPYRKLSIHLPQTTNATIRVTFTPQPA
ncbi:MAG: heparinase II/III family protein [Planctomycetota bacterium]